MILASIRSERAEGSNSTGGDTGTENVSTEWGSLSDSFDDVWLAGFHRFFHLTPDLQIVQNQIDGDDTAVILGVRGTLDF